MPSWLVTSRKVSHNRLAALRLNTGLAVCLLTLGTLLNLNKEHYHANGQGLSIGKLVARDLGIRLATAGEMGLGRLLR
jgi:hypothetical protein